jgi:hypothetical protein
MYGWINNIIEKYVLSTVDGTNIWQSVKLAAECDVANDGWIFSHSYPMEHTTQLLAAASNALNLSPDLLLEELGRHLISYSRYFSCTNL